jgi:hypothetical protein
MYANRAVPKRQNSKHDSDALSGIGVILYGPFCVAGRTIYAHREVLNAASTLVIGAFTVMLFIATFLQYGQLRKTLELNRRDFDATHRPWISIGTIQIERATLVSTSLILRSDFRLKTLGGLPPILCIAVLNVFMMETSFPPGRDFLS